MTIAWRGEKVRRKWPHLKSLFVIFLLAESLSAQAVANKDTKVTAVKGESWLKHLDRAFGDTSMGKTSSLGPAPPDSGKALPLGN